MPARREYYECNWVLYFKCKDCGVFKTAEYFSKHIRCFMWITNICKDCEKITHAKYHAEHRQEDNRKNRERWLLNKDRINQENREKYRNDAEFRKLCSERAKVWREENKEANLKHHKEYYEENKEMLLAKNKIRYENNKEKILKQHKEYNKTHREETKKRSSLYKKSHRDMMNVYQRWLRERRWPQYSKAHRLVEKKLKEIWLKWERCPMCLQEWLVVCHHPDYNKPYEVVPCCNLCHSQIHRWIIECPKPIDLLRSDLLRCLENYSY